MKKKIPRDGRENSLRASAAPSSGPAGGKGGSGATGGREGDLRRVLSGLDAAMLSVGIVVGTGIFAVPGFVARELGAPGPILVVWLLGGLVTLAGALTYAELASLFPRQGGNFLYVLHAFGPFAAFFKGWGFFLVGFPAACAVVASILGSYFAAAVGGGETTGRLAAWGVVTIVWLLNLRGTRFSAALQTGVTLAKVGAIVILAVLALAVGPGRWDRLLAAGSGWPPLTAFAAAMIGVLWTFDGWGNLTVVAGEVRDPRRRIIRALLGTAAVVAGLYLLLNVGYLVLLPLEELAGSDSVAASAAEAVIGPAGGKLVAWLVVLSAFGALFGISITAPRYYYAMAQQGLFFRAAGRVDPETAAPRWGATALFLVTLAYLGTGSFRQIMGFYVAVSLVYSTLSILAVYPLRRRSRDREGIFRVPGYPITPAIVVAASLWVTVSEILSAPVRTGIGLGVLVLAAPVYLLWRRAR